VAVKTTGDFRRHFERGGQHQSEKNGNAY
jgi:hypothetical protein